MTDAVLVDNNHDNALDKPPASVRPSSLGEDVSGSSSSETAPEVPAQEVDIPDLEDETEPIDVRSEIQGFDISVAQEETRAKIALYFTVFFLMMVFLAVVAPFIGYGIQPSLFPQPLDSAKDLLTVLSSVLAGPFGFIVGFYFKQNDR